MFFKKLQGHNKEMFGESRGGGGTFLSHVAKKIKKEKPNKIRITHKEGTWREQRPL
jgi:hypothetical protein